MEQRLKALETPLAHELAETLLHQVDMRSSIATIKLWHEKFASSEDDETRLIGQSLFRDAITMFVGCFDKTSEFPLDANAIYGKDPNGLSSFQWFKNIRDAYAAHKFGAQRQCIVGVITHSETGEVGFGHLFARYAGQNKEDGPQLQGFMQTAEKYLDQRVVGLQQKLLAFIKTMTPEQIAALKDASVHTLEQGEARLTRSGLQRARAGLEATSRKS